MNTAMNTEPLADIEHEPAWDVALLFPGQGEWTEDDYLRLSGRRLVELSNGGIEVLPMPTTSHQRIVAALYRLLAACVEPAGLGTLLFAPLRVRLWPGKIREPDLVFLLAEHGDRIGEQAWQGADLVVEVISPDDRRRDTELKRREYAQAGIGEYWIVDPEERSILLLALEDGRYAELGRFRDATPLPTRVLAGCMVGAAEVFEAAGTARA